MLVADKLRFCVGSSSLVLVDRRHSIYRSPANDSLSHLKDRSKQASEGIQLLATMTPRLKHTNM